ncbi:unnamed protein product [Durusdinium trenchii]|uniref:Ankyrin repeat and KH domain-containing protein mask (Multiple ankyrin repeat single KH domain-containing protein) n=2 Tax=Durusdinium trenchii TaxID=1381693 RepID=A0ABP0QIM2_9DINO
MTSNLLAALKSQQGKGVTVTVHPLIEAAKTGSEDACQRALKEPKVKVDQKDSVGMSALMHAAELGHMHVVKFLVDHGARVSAKDDLGETALMKACKAGHTDVIKFLIDSQVMQRKKTGGTVMGDAQKTKRMERQRVLDVKDDDGVTALMKAAENDESEALRLLIDEGASLDLKDDHGWTVLMWAALAGSIDICEMLVKNYDSAPDYATERGESALMKAAANGHWDVCEYLLEEGAKVNQLDAEHQTALMWASAMGHAAVVKGLIGREAKVDLPCKGGKTALMMACALGRDLVVGEILTSKARVDQQDSEGHNALFSTIQCGSQEIVTMLLQHRCPIEAHSKKGETPLMWAAKEQQVDCLKVLINARADLNAQDENGQRAIDHAEGTLNSKAGHASHLISHRHLLAPSLRALRERRFSGCRPAAASHESLGQWHSLTLAVRNSPLARPIGHQKKIRQHQQGDGLAPTWSPEVEPYNLKRSSFGVFWSPAPPHKHHKPSLPISETVREFRC